MRRGRHRGFNLIEILFGCAIFAVSFLGIVSVFPTSMRAVQQGKETMLALDLAEQLLDEDLAVPFSQQVNQQSHLTLTSTVNGVKQFMTYNYQIIVTPVQPNLLDDVRVFVTWSSGAGSQSTIRSVSLESMLNQLNQ